MKSAFLVVETFFYKTFIFLLRYANSLSHLELLSLTPSALMLSATHGLAQLPLSKTGNGPFLTGTLQTPLSTPLIFLIPTLFYTVY